jgi:hypothetical protein
MQPVLTYTTARPDALALVDAALNHYCLALALGQTPRDFRLGLEGLAADWIAPEILQELLEQGLIEPAVTGQTGAGYVLTQRTADWLEPIAAAVGAGAIAPHAGLSKPRPSWHATQRELHFGSEVIVRLSPRGWRQESILKQFQSANWARRVAFPADTEPGSRGLQRLRQALLSLNERQQPAHLEFWLERAAPGWLRWSHLN